MTGGWRLRRHLGHPGDMVAAACTAACAIVLGPAIVHAGAEPVPRPAGEGILHELVLDRRVERPTDLFDARLDGNSDLASFLTRRSTPRSTPPRLSGFGRVAASEDPAEGRLGIGGVDLTWRPDPILSIGVMAGGPMDVVDATRGHPDPGDLASFGDAPDRAVPDLAGRSTAFDGLGFGGESAADVSPFLADRVYRSTGATDLRSTFAATRAVLRPLGGTSVGLVATRGGGRDGDASLVGFDVSQAMAGQQVDAWIQQSMGGPGDEDRGSDRSAFGASLGGDLAGIRYGVGWRRIGRGFESGLGSTGRAGSHAMTGRLDWRLPIDGIPLIRSWEVGVRARYETDLAMDPSRFLVDIDAMRLTATSGDTIEFGIRQERMTDATAFEASNLVERFRLAVASDASRPLRIGGGVTFGDPEGLAATTWEGKARWAPGGGFDLGGVISIDETFAGREASDTIRTAVDGRFGLGRLGTALTRVDFDARRRRLAVVQAIGLDFDAATSLSVSVEQDWPTEPRPGEDGVVRARIGGSFRF